MSRRNTLLSYVLNIGFISLLISALSWKLIADRPAPIQLSLTLYYKLTSECSVAHDIYVDICVGWLVGEGSFLKLQLSIDEF